MYVLSQICAVVSTVFLGLSYFAKNKRNIMLLCLIYCVFYGIHYLLLSAITGMLMTFISSIRNICFYTSAKKGRQNSHLSLIAFVLIGIFGMAFTYQNIFSIVSMCGNIISTYSVWQSSVFKYRVLSILVSICFLIYAISIGSIFAILTETCLLIIEIICVYKYRKEVLN